MISHLDSFAFCLSNNDVTIFSLHSGLPLVTFSAHNKWISRVLCHDYKLITVSKDFTIKVWDIRTLSGQNKTHFEDIPVTIYDH